VGLQRNTFPSGTNPPAVYIQDTTIVSGHSGSGGGMGGNETNSGINFDDTNSGGNIEVVMTGGTIRNCTDIAVRGYFSTSQYSSFNLSIDNAYLDGGYVSGTRLFGLRYGLNAFSNTIKNSTITGWRQDSRQNCLMGTDESRNFRRILWEGNTISNNRGMWAAGDIGSSSDDVYLINNYISDNYDSYLGLFWNFPTGKDVHIYRNKFVGNSFIIFGGEDGGDAYVFNNMFYNNTALRDDFRENLLFGGKSGTVTYFYFNTCGLISGQYIGNRNNGGAASYNIFTMTKSAAFGSDLPSTSEPNTYSYPTSNFVDYANADLHLKDTAAGYGTVASPSVTDPEGERFYDHDGGERPGADSEYDYGADEKGVTAASPPEIVNDLQNETAQRTDGSYLVDVNFEGRDNDGDYVTFVNADCEYSLDSTDGSNGTWNDMTRSGTGGITFTNSWVDYTYVWDMGTDVAANTEDDTVYV
jgi:hypothetical protein